MLENHKTVFTLSLGLANLIADFRFIGKFKAKLVNGRSEVKSIATTDANLIIEKGKRYGKINGVPTAMNNERELTEFKDFYIELNGDTLLIDGESYQVVSEENERIVLF